MANRASQDVGETAASGTPAARASQDIAETAASGTPSARSSQIVGEAAGSGTPSARASQNISEAAASGTPKGRVSQFLLEILVRSIDVTQPPIYPDLPGLTYSTFWAPAFYNASEKGSTGVEVDLPLASAPTHEFELTYSVLRNTFGDGAIEFKTMMGFFLQIGGQAGRFLFPNKSDRKVTGQSIATTASGVLTYGPISRTFGAGGYGGTEPVGYVDPVAEQRFYLDGNLLSTSAYSIVYTTPGSQQFLFAADPGAGHVLTGDFSYYYYCKFSDDQLSFEQFMKELWALKKVVIRSVRAAT